MTFDDFSQAYRLRVEGVLEHYLPSLDDQPHQLHAAMRYAALNPGKRMRPLLVYATGLMLDDASKLDQAAAAVELIHAYSLVHDDLPCMDDDSLRRGLPTCHIRFDEATAVLAGDALQTLAFEVLTDANNPQTSDIQLNMLRLLSQASGSAGMGGGQAMDLAATGQTLSLSQLEQMHQMKTGALIQASVILGYLAAGGTCDREIDVLTQYGESIGLAFQIVDDILDVESDTQTLGKPQGSDAAADKMTYPVLLGMSGAKQHAQLHYEKALQALSELPYNTQRLAAFAAHIVNRDR